MTKFTSTLLLVLLSAIALALGVIAYNTTVMATPPEPYNTVLECPYEVGECPSAEMLWNELRKDYQIELSMDTIRVWEGRRLVGQTVDTTIYNTELGKIIMKDNE